MLDIGKSLRQCVAALLLICGVVGAKEGTGVIVLETNHGNIEIALMPDVAPKASENFEKLAEKGYYDGVSFHRIIPGFMIQGGDPTGTGAGGESIWGEVFEDEYAEGVVFDRPGLLAMANRGPKTNGSQFFITTAAAPWLNRKHTIFGEVVSGQDVVQKIEAQGSQSGKPKSPVVIQRAYTKK